MGKSRSNKRKYKYTKQEFVNICCEKCGICKQGTSPDLCYSELYLEQPKKFIKVVFRNLLEIKKLTDKNGYVYLYTATEGVEYLEYLFKRAFCSANLCGQYKGAKQCSNIIGCIAAFRQQVKGYDKVNGYDNVYTSISTKQPKKKGKKKKKQRYVAEPYPTFFTNGKATFLREIQIALGNEPEDDSNNQQQDTVGELTSSTEEASNTGA